MLGPVVTASYFGRKDFSRIFSMVSMFSFIGIAISAPGLGFVFDLTDSYDMAWVMIIVVGMTVCVSSISAYKTSKILKALRQSKAG